MNKFIIIGIIIAIIIGIISLVSGGTLIENLKGGMKSTPESTEKANGNESMPKGRNLTLEFNEKMGLSAP
jgi:hypothetical protein